MPPSSKTSGFTLIEIMIVVAIIALLATIAVPNFLRARKRAQATLILKEADMLTDAAHLYAAENPSLSTSEFPWIKIRPYIKEGTRLYSAFALPNRVYDPFGHLYVGTRVGGGLQVLVDGDTKSNFADVIDDPETFWGSH